jgi:hypothetical protein
LEKHHLKNYVDQTFIIFLILFSFLSLIIKSVLLINVKEYWNDFSSINASISVGSFSFSDITLMIGQNILFFLIVVVSAFISNKFIYRYCHIGESRNKSTSNSMLFLFFIFSLILLYFVRVFSLFNVGIHAESLPLKLYGQLKILALTIPSYTAYLFAKSNKRFFTFFSILLVLIFAMYGLILSGSKFAFLSPILLYALLIRKNSFILFSGICILILYVLFNPYAFRSYLEIHGSAFDILDMLNHVVSDSVSFDRFIQGIILIIDRLPGADVIINNYVNTKICNSTLDMNYLYNQCLLNAGNLKGSFATSMVGYFLLLFDQFSYILIGFYIVVIFLILFILLKCTKFEYRNLSICSFYMFFLADFLDGNFQLLYTYMSMFYFPIILMLISVLGDLFRQNHE